VKKEGEGGFCSTTIITAKKDFSFLLFFTYRGKSNKRNSKAKNNAVR